LPPAPINHLGTTVEESAVRENMLYKATRKTHRVILDVVAQTLGPDVDAVGELG
jgi:hypothetical protein